MVVNIDVPELEPAIAFYTAVLGLEHTRTLEADVAELAGASCVIYLLRNPAGSRSGGPGTETRRYSRHWTPVHVDFVVEDLEQAATRASQAGAIREGECVAWRGSRCMTFSDPFGHGFCLIEFGAETYA